MRLNPDQSDFEKIRDLLQQANIPFEALDESKIHGSDIYEGGSASERIFLSAIQTGEDGEIWFVFKHGQLLSLFSGNF